ncbi:DUF2236 domain-containing protein [Gramella lutea]|uniref:DUF2236 domain-containing protein n=1 Tax=Christiangramia lutea TaxID=1607951 RepID=A0A9X1V2R1_9FLAO|nr:oxygenase MpaB family protein [Christiangramia lutea]MCH4823382.1 DUF2236 domain-containing protein [Christiangramia lutea]
MDYFVKKDSIVREIWGKSDTILFIFAGASAEFALNKGVDWLFYTGRLPEDPLGRLFSTVEYARKIVFSPKHEAETAIQKINTIHASVEGSRGKSIPDWAYRDVLFMLIDYSIRSCEILKRPLSYSEKEEVLEVFHRVGKGMHMRELPNSFEDFKSMRKNHLEQHLAYGDFSRELYRQYRKHLGYFRYRLLIETQILICPKTVKKIMFFRKVSVLSPLLFFYRFSRKINLDWLLKSLILPSEYKSQIKSLNHHPNHI